MKIERLYAITVYLLNHGRTSARMLATFFEVSVRTIQRDVDSLCIAGIPIVALAGPNGGYEISEQFKLDNSFMDPEDYSFILTALKGLVSATEDMRVKQTLEKISYLAKKPSDNVILDFSVLREGDQNMLQVLQNAVVKKRTVEFAYTNNNNETRVHSVEPIAVIYRWYAWYLLAYSKAKEDYRFYKLVRMRELKITKHPFIKEHEASNIILQKTDQTDSRKYIDVLMRCNETAKTRVLEYLKGNVIENFANGDTLMKVTVVENEQLWIGTLLSLGDSVEILEPEEVRDRLIESAAKILALYR